MTELTAQKIHLAALAIAALRLSGRIPAGHEVSLRHFERISKDIGFPVSSRDVGRLEALAITKAKYAALALQKKQSSTL